MKVEAGRDLDAADSFEEKMKYQMKAVPLVVFILVIVTGIFDLYCVVFGGVNGTISAFIVDTVGVKAPWVFFVFGCVAGHLFFSGERTQS